MSRHFDRLHPYNASNNSNNNNNNSHHISNNNSNNSNNNSSNNNNRHNNHVNYNNNNNDQHGLDEDNDDDDVAIIDESLARKIAKDTGNANDIASRRLAHGTVGGYQGKVRTIIAYLKRMSPSSVMSHSIDVLPIPKGALILMGGKTKRTIIDYPVLPINGVLIRAFFGAITAEANRMVKRGNRNTSDVAAANDADDDVEDERVETKKLYGKGAIQGFKSGLVWYLKEMGTKLEDKDDSDINDLVIGYKKLNGQMKTSGLISSTEGFKPLSFNGYVLMNRKMLGRIDWSGGAFDYCFSVLNWNIGSRPTNVDTLNLSHIGWGGDCITVVLGNQKGDQTGESIMPVHMYNNAQIPEVCVFLALAVYLFSVFSSEEVVTPTTMLFKLGSQDVRFGRGMNRTLESFTDEEKACLGFNVSQLGVYSIRKGWMTHCRSQMGGPDGFATKQRAGSLLRPPIS